MEDGWFRDVSFPRGACWAEVSYKCLVNETPGRICKLTLHRFPAPAPREMPPLLAALSALTAGLRVLPLRPGGELCPSGTGVRFSRKARQAVPRSLALGGDAGTKLLHP